MSKFDATYDMILVNIPVAYQISSNTLSSISYSSPGSYSIPAQYSGLLKEYGDLVTSVWGNPNLTGLGSTVGNVVSSMANLPTIPTLSSLSTTVSSAYSNVSSVISNIIPNYSLTDTFSSYKNVLLSTSDINTVASAISITEPDIDSVYQNITNELSSIYGNVSNSINSFSTQASTIISDMQEFILSTAPQLIETYIQNRPMFQNIESKVNSIINNVDVNQDYQTFISQTAPSIAAQATETVTQYMVSNLEIAKRNFFYGYERFAGRRIGMTNFIDIYTARETLKTVKELKANIYDRMLNAINTYYLEHIRLNYDLVKAFAQFTLSVYLENLKTYMEYTKNYLESMRIQLATLSEIPKIYTNIYQAVANALAEYMRSAVGIYTAKINKYQLTMSYLLDVYKNASIAATQLTERKEIIKHSLYENFVKLYLSNEQIKTQLNNEFSTKEFDMKLSLNNARAQYIQAAMNFASYRYDKSLELMAHMAGVPNTVQRGLSQFERAMAPVSLVLNTLASIGGMVLPFI